MKYPVNRYNSRKLQDILFTVNDPRIKIDKYSGCWLWQQCCDRDGYGVAWYKGKNIKAHQAFYTHATGKSIVGRHLHHRCQIKKCCNPDHLKRLRPAKHNSLEKKVLSSRIVRQIRFDYGKHSLNGKGRSHKSVSMQALADKYNVCSTTIYHVVSRKGYKNV